MLFAYTVYLQGSESELCELLAKFSYSFLFVYGNILKGLSFEIVQVLIEWFLAQGSPIPFNQVLSCKLSKWLIATLLSL